MDLLCKAYAAASDDEDEEKPNHGNLSLPPPKRFKPQYPLPIHKPNPVSSLPSNVLPDYRTETPIPGRYISKRERAISPSIPAVPHPNLNSDSPVISSPVLGSISDSDLPREIISSLRRQAKVHAVTSGKLSVVLHGHMKAVNAIHWSPTHAHLLASAGMDHTIHIWNVWTRDHKPARLLKFHNAAVKDVKWSQQGLSVLSCGYDCSSRLVDVEKGVETSVCKEDQVVGVVKFHPDNSNLFLSGGSKGRIRLWDIRTGKTVHEYIRGLGPILDVEFTLNGKQFISTSDVSGSNISENSIIVWDISRQVPLSNQVYVEAYTCPCVRSHPFEPFFVAQSNGNYIGIFSSLPPFKLDKYKRYESHGVFGFPIKCNFSSDGEKLVSGSADGSIYFYNYRLAKLIGKIKAFEQACIDVAIHPIMPNVVASCSWNGEVSIFE